MPLYKKIFLGLLIGTVSGLSCNIFFTDAPAVTWFAQNIAGPTGQLFLRIIFMAVIPLVIAALANGVAEIGDVSKVGRIGIKTLLFTLLLSSIAVLIGIGIVNYVQPGIGLPEEARSKMVEMLQSQGAKLNTERATQIKPFTQILLELIPKNPVADMLNAFDGGLLALMVFSLFIGLAMSAVGEEKAEPLKKFFESLFNVMLKIIEFAMYLAPFGVAGLMFSVTSSIGFSIVTMLGKYVLVVISALAIHQFLIYGLTLKIFTKRKPSEFYRAIREVMITAFSTSSSNATLPLAMKTAEENLKLPRKVSNFILTIGATANQNGTALYEGITVLFLAQFFGVQLSFVQQLTVVLMSVAAGVGTAGVPGGSLPLIVVVLQSIGVPGEGIGIILGVDRILDMSRTVLNVTGDLTIATCVAESEKNI